jgi:hypothetical protein
LAKTPHPVQRREPTSPGIRRMASCCQNTGLQPFPQVFNLRLFNLRPPGSWFMSRPAFWILIFSLVFIRRNAYKNMKQNMCSPPWKCNGPLPQAEPA